MSRLSLDNQKNLNRFFDWIDTTGRAQIVSFNLSGRELYELTNNDPLTNITTSVEYIIHDKISKWISVPEEKKEYFIEKSMPWEWTSTNDPDLYVCYQMLKFLWLAKDIGGDNQEAPVQIIQHGRKYSCHPGSDKRVVVSYLKPLEVIRCFYIWYPEFDNAPIHWMLPHEEISEPIDFEDMFVRCDDETFQLKYEEINFTKQGFSDDINHHFGPWAAGMHLAHRKWGKIKNNKFNVTIPTISYHDGVHRRQMDKSRDLLRDIKVRFDTFKYGDFDFIKYNGMWRLKSRVHYPASIVDENHHYDKDRAMSFGNKNSSIPKHRKYM